MVTLREKLEHWVPPQATLVLPFEQRQKSRLRVQLTTGEEAGVVLPRGTVLRHGDLLRADNGVVVEVQADSEPVTTVASQDSVLLARACYHLGNRHVSLQIGDGWIRYRRDHVLDDMVSLLGLEISHELAAFEPEAGAYGHVHRHSQ